MGEALRNCALYEVSRFLVATYQIYNSKNGEGSALLDSIQIKIN